MEQPVTAFIAGSVVMISQVLVPIILLYFVWSFPVQFKFAGKKTVKNTIITIAVIFILSGIILAGSLYFTNLNPKDGTHYGRLSFELHLL